MVWPPRIGVSWSRPLLVGRCSLGPLQISSRALSCKILPLQWRVVQSGWGRRAQGVRKRIASGPGLGALPRTRCRLDVPVRRSVAAVASSGRPDDEAQSGQGARRGRRRGRVGRPTSSPPFSNRPWASLDPPAGRASWVRRDPDFRYGPGFSGRIPGFVLRIHHCQHRGPSPTTRRANGQCPKTGRTLTRRASIAWSPDTTASTTIGLDRTTVRDGMVPCFLGYVASPGLCRRHVHAIHDDCFPAGTKCVRSREGGRLREASFRSVLRGLRDSESPMNERGGEPCAGPASAPGPWRALKTVRASRSTPARGAAPHRILCTTAHLHFPRCPGPGPGSAVVN